MPNQIPDTLTEVGNRAVALLADRGPLSEADLLAALTGAGADLGRDPRATLDNVLESDSAPMVLPLADGRLAHVPSLLAGRVFTHRLSAAEVEHDFLAVTSDLQPLSMLTEVDTYQHLVDGSPVTDLMADFDADLIDERGIPVDLLPELAMLLPPGHLGALGARPGDLVALRVDPAGWGLERIDEDSVDRGATSAVGEVLQAGLADDRPSELDSAVWTACASDPGLFRRPLPPLGDVLDECGLQAHGDYVAAADFDFPGWRLTHRIESLCSRHQLDEDEALVVLTVVTLYDKVAVRVATAVDVLQDGGELDEVLSLGAASTEHVDSAVADPDRAGRALVREMLPFLAEPAIAAAVLAETIGAGREGAAALGVFAESLEPMAPRSARVALRWLRAKALERLGSVGEAETELGAAQSLDPSWSPVLFDLAHFASDRGDADRGLDLLRRAGAPPEDFLVVLLERFRPPQRTGLARNQPCWCGSGRKYKQCHLHREQLPLDERAAWLYQKAGIYLADGPWRNDVVQVAAARSAYDHSPDALYAATTDPVVVDIVLFEGGAFAAFLDERGALLPDDERLLGEQWLLVERSVFEVEEVAAGRGMTVRDLRTGDRHEVRERTASRQLERGMLLCGRIVPAGETTQVFGGLELIDLHQRDNLIALLDDEPHPVELVSFLSRRFAPPQMQNTEGEPVVICQTRLRVPDPVALSTALDRTYEREGGAGSMLSWHEYVTTSGMQRVRASMRLVDDALTVETNSEVRMDRVLAVLRGLDSGLKLVDETRQTAADLMEASSRAGLPPAGESAATAMLDPGDPQVAALLEQMTHQHERAWLDESIPALAGYTPRQAAADPTRRPDLLRLLDSFAADEGRPGLMSPRRLRAALDLD